MDIILASGSPRRLELLEQLGMKPKVVVSSFTEATGAMAPLELVKANALGKGREVAEKYPEAVVIAADTIVVDGSEILGKPHNIEQARAMLAALSGKTHQVLTGYAVFYKGQEVAKVESTDVEFYELSPKLIKSYVATGEPLDKAGSYGIQGKGAVLVKQIKGSYSNVVGLPLGPLYGILVEMGVIKDESFFNEGASLQG